MQMLLEMSNTFIYKKSYFQLTENMLANWSNDSV